jgi:hypothetical protein
VQQGRSERRGEAYFGPYVEPLSDARTKLAGFFNILSGLLEDDAWPRWFHLEDLQGVIDAFGRMVQDETRIGDMRIEQFVLPAAVIEITVINLTVLIDVIVQSEFGLGECLSVDNDVVWLESHKSFAWRTIAKCRKDVNGSWRTI